MKRFPAPALALSACLFAASAAAAQNAPADKAAPGSVAARIANAMSAAPASIAAQATIVDWPASPGGKPVTLREGSNGWVCYPKAPAKDENDPMCLDASWQKWGEAYMNKQAPKITALGIAYMIAPGGASGSGTDPFASQRTDTNDWGFDGPHLMILAPDASIYQGLPTKRGTGPYVMWAGTPWAHVMVPLTDNRR